MSSLQREFVDDDESRLVILYMEYSTMYSYLLIHSVTPL
jgi:hypothetical protein